VDVFPNVRVPEEKPVGRGINLPRDVKKKNVGSREREMKERKKQETLTNERGVLPSGVCGTFDGSICSALGFYQGRPASSSRISLGKKCSLYDGKEGNALIPFSDPKDPFLGKRHTFKGRKREEYFFLEKSFTPPIQNREEGKPKKSRCGYLNGFRNGKDIL